MLSRPDATPGQLPATLRVASELMQRSPEEAFVLMDRPDYDMLSVCFPRYIEQTIESASDTRLSQGLLRQGLMATGAIILRTIALSEQEITYEQANRIAEHDDTVAVMSAVAMQDEESAGELVRGASYSSCSVFKLSTSGDSIVIRPGMRIPEAWPGRGCPAAGSTIEGAPPLFRNFVKWSGSLAVHSYYHADKSSESAPSLLGLF